MKKKTLDGGPYIKLKFVIKVFILFLSFKIIKRHAPVEYSLEKNFLLFFKYLLKEIFFYCCFYCFYLFRQASKNCRLAFISNVKNIFPITGNILMTLSRHYSDNKCFRLNVWKTWHVMNHEQKKIYKILFGICTWKILPLMKILHSL